jgi:tryptophan synthase beta chain
MTTYRNPDENGYYGEFGGAFVPEMLYPNVEELQQNYIEIIESEEFKKELNDLLKDYVGRATPLYFAKNLSEKYGTNVYLKREDLNHTGAHKINNALGQVLLAKKLGKKNYCRNRSWTTRCCNGYSLRFDEFRMHRLYGRN